ncbi:type IV pilin N-terminal domain-containing protein [Haloarcula sediminis]|uniref:type IV pilin N-terminal domain-containing protein n=1 Tax=Haloarcula sediminis TaxID=3111777 RepID=UPI002D783A50|nr:type IV pilin N-terminal domain-containing protein [Haloarcula sp. CK38]
MNFKELLTNDDAVSPVIGVILMVAITVILAAVIATFVLGLGDSLSNSAPQANFDFDYDSSANDLTITHEGGDAIPESEIALRGASSGSNEGPGIDWDGSETAGDADITAGSSYTYTGVESGDTVRVIWQDSNGDNSATIGNWDGPDA